MKVEEICRAILDLDENGIIKVVAAIKQARSIKDRKSVFNFSEGDSVYFNSGRKYGIVHGTVKKINNTTVKLQDNKTGMTWRVAPSLLKKDTN